MIRCIVHGCENHQGEGGFVGQICWPCYSTITTGVVSHGTSFINKLSETVDKLKRGDA